jgi:hypothetical protein
MQINAQILIPFPRSLVFATYRDQLLNLIPYLPNVKGIEFKSRTEVDGLVNLVNIWHGGGEIPPPARALLSESMLSWTEHATWNAAEFTADWQIETHAFTEAVDCVGKNYFLESAGGTQLISKGKLAINRNKIDGVPHFLAQMIGGVVEEFLGSKIEPNLLQLGEGVCAYLEKESRALAQ